ncbi:MAG TPA: hypothetical protein VEH81_15350 [Ktedonobacteraceae bacterium]|nr:hypothetical protein [Ktedonobacteraceae bacterium]
MSRQADMGAVADRMNPYPFSTGSIMEFRDGKVARETQSFAGLFDPPPWRAEWVERRE